MAALKIHRGPINSDPAAEVPRAQWGELLVERRKFCQQIVPQDCRNLLFFIQDGAANDWLGLGDREQYIREGLKLDPKMVNWALEGLRATRPDVAVKFADAVKLGKQGGDRKSEKFKEQQNQPWDTSLKYGTAAHVRRRLERDAKRKDLPPERREQVSKLLDQVETGKLSANAAAIELGWDHRTVRVRPTVEGFARAAERSLTKSERAELKECL